MNHNEMRVLAENSLWPLQARTGEAVDPGQPYGLSSPRHVQR